uniref:F-box domain-containing protein n=2 Tax=Sexangularia sp. CB-2014 TaxID=1486929 RepID=A0A7S1V9U5_9EUKA
MQISALPSIAISKICALLPLWDVLALAGTSKSLRAIILKGEWVEPLLRHILPAPPGDGIVWDGRFGRRYRPSYCEATEAMGVHWPRKETRRAHLNAIVARSVTFLHRARYPFSASFTTSPCVLIGCHWHEVHARRQPVTGPRNMDVESAAKEEEEEEEGPPWWLVSTYGTSVQGAPLWCSLWDTVADAKRAQSLAVRSPRLAILVAHMAAATVRRISNRVLCESVWHLTIEWELAQGLPHILDQGVNVFHLSTGLSVHPTFGSWPYYLWGQPSDRATTSITVGNFPTLSVHRDETDGRFILENHAVSMSQVPRADRTPLEVSLAEQHATLLEYFDNK